MLGFIFARNDFPTIGSPSWTSRRLPFQISEKINDIDYKIYLSDKNQVYPIFNVCDPSTFYAQPDSKMNPFQEGGNDTIMDASFIEES